MSYIELHCHVECPHCGYDNCEHVEFDIDCIEGASSGIRKAECFSCFKDFWFDANCFLEVQTENVFKTKPKKGV